MIVNATFSKMHINTSGNTQTILVLQSAHIFTKVIESLSCKRRPATQTVFHAPQSFDKNSPL